MSLSSITGLFHFAKNSLLDCKLLLALEKTEEKNDHVFTRG